MKIPAICFVLIISVLAVGTILTASNLQTSSAMWKSSVAGFSSN